MAQVDTRVPLDRVEERKEGPAVTLKEVETGMLTKNKNSAVNSTLLTQHLAHCAASSTFKVKEWRTRRSSTRPPTRPPR